MKLYIPEIGDQIRLTQDWSFTLHAEERNADLAAVIGCYFRSGLPNLFVKEDEVPMMRNRDYVVDYSRVDAERNSWRPNWEKINALEKECSEACPEYVKYWADYKEWSDKCKEVGVDQLNMTLPAGTILKVDRIYIRKGNSDYSSISFYASGLGKVEVWAPSYGNDRTKKSKSSLRFWAKLQDCNQIEFEPA